jgi:hypothetical protein
MIEKLFSADTRLRRLRALLKDNGSHDNEARVHLIGRNLRRAKNSLKCVNIIEREEDFWSPDAN